MTRILSHLPIKQEIIPTIFWVDNFDVTIDKQCGAGTVNTTHLVAFQESDGFSAPFNNITIPRSKKGKLSEIHKEHISITNVKSNAESPMFDLARLKMVGIKTKVTSLAAVSNQL